MIRRAWADRHPLKTSKKELSAFSIENQVGLRLVSATLPLFLRGRVHFEENLLLSTSTDSSSLDALPFEPVSHLAEVMYR